MTTVYDINDLSTYLVFKESRYLLIRDGISESEIYPSKSLQIKDLLYDHIQGNIRLSKNQRKEINRQQIKSKKNFIKKITQN